MNRFFFILFFCFFNTAFSQCWSLQNVTIPVIRQKFHDDIDITQQNILSTNCKKDSIYLASNNTDVNLLITYYLKNKVDELQYSIEFNNNYTNADKYKWLRSLKDLLYSYNQECKYAALNKTYLKDIIIAFEQAMTLQQNNQSITPIIELNNAQIGNILLNNFAFEKNAGITESRYLIISKLCKENPTNTLKILEQYPNLPNADSLIIDFAHLYPQSLYDYAASTKELGQRIRSINEPYVALISSFANVKEGRYLFPFVDAIAAKKTTTNDVIKTIDDDEAYYKLLINTLNYYEVEKQKGKEPLVMQVLVDKVKSKAVEVYITPINNLHNENNLAIRFDKIKNLTPLELYYLTVMGEDEMYTSSFISGVYPKITKDLGTIKTDSLLKMANYGYYRKFIKMCASFNMLEDFLAKMDKPVAENLMKSFSNGLENYESLEQAVDVADSYASIKDSSIKKIIKAEVRKNIDTQFVAKNKKGIVIYSLLNQIFNAFDSTPNANVAKLFNIPSVFELKNNNLKSSNGRIYVQQFFYGDKDGKFIYQNFISIFKQLGWQVINKEYWVEVNNNTNTPITIFCNKPLDEEKGLDDEAQQKLYHYLDSLNIYPAITIHRGHSYYLKATIKQLTSYAQLVLLGSCGGYHSLAKVLEITPQTQIIASKQIGTGSINARIIELIFETLKQGKDINWIELWKTLENKFANSKELKERFDDYIPPQKNLGALFIMAYYKAFDSM